MRRAAMAMLCGASVLLPAVPVNAHISVASGPGFANTTQEIAFGVGHGCSGMDTYSVRIEIPSSVTSVRTETSDFGAVTIEKDAAGLINAVTWQKAEGGILDGDTAYYRLLLRLKVPDQPFSTVYFPAHQTCRSPDGGAAVVDWIATAPNPDGGGPEPAPALPIVPPRSAGWNKVTVPIAVDDLGAFFGDALIVWRGNEAYSANPNTAALIANTAGVTLLAGLAANDEIWVKY